MATEMKTEDLTAFDMQTIIRKVGLHFNKSNDTIEAIYMTLPKEDLEQEMRNSGILDAEGKRINDDKIPYFALVEVTLPSKDIITILQTFTSKEELRSRARKDLNLSKILTFLKAHAGIIVKEGKDTSAGFKGKVLPIIEAIEKHRAKATSLSENMLAISKILGSAKIDGGSFDKVMGLLKEFIKAAKLDISPDDINRLKDAMK